MKNRYLTAIVFLVVTVATIAAVLYLNKNAKAAQQTAGDTIPKQIDLSRCEAYLKRINSANEALDWKQLKCGLWRNKQGDIGFKTSRVVCSDGLFIADDYIIRFGFNENPPLKNIVDTATFVDLGNTYFKDKNNIYHHYSMSDGGSFYIFEDADYQTFEILGDCYAKDKNHIFESRAGILTHVDHGSFKTKAGNSGCVAKDKNGYFIWGDRVKLEEIEDKVILQAIQALDTE